MERQKTLKDPVALSDFLTQEGFSDKRIAVERNGEIVPKRGNMRM